MALRLRFSFVLALTLALAAGPALGRPQAASAKSSKATSAEQKSKAALKPKPSTRPKARPSAAKPRPRSKPTRPAVPAVKLAPIPEDIGALGPMSVGHPHAGYLVNGVKLPQSPDWVITVPSHGYGTQETNDALAHCIGKVRREIEGSPPVMLGSLSSERGGLLPPHKSHRTGRDVDVYFFRKPGATWSKAATQADIDLPRTWALLKCFVTETDVDMILIDRRVQGWLEAHALATGEDRGWVQALFHDRGSYKTAVVRHVPGHVAHMHVRFTSPKARRLAVAHYDRLVESGVVMPERQGVVHVVQAGDTLSGLARRYQTTVPAIQAMNGLTSTVIRLGQKLTLEQPVDLRGARDPVATRPRHLPPGFVPSRAPVVARASEPRPPPVLAAHGPDAELPRELVARVPEALSRATRETDIDPVRDDGDLDAASAPADVVPPGPPPRPDGALRF